ncbi:MAG TPA: MBL fold metallo-hydrolase [Solirubrobacteraceae bacterium]|jgi:glyoxylase-like metal-dependent hydrolase (beta-lactamase superfamily II)/rhodanese-related sulfurtransferase
MIFRQIIHDDLGCASYLIGDEHAGMAAVIDPKLDISEYLALARFMDVRIAHVLETHNHADHVSGHGRLVAATGARVHVHRSAEPEYEHETFDDRWELELGRVRVRALHTPGHRPEHTAFALIDTVRGPEPWAVLTGDSLFVGDIARPDLAVEKAQGARGIYRSLHEQLLKLPDTCEVWPGHLGGSLCGGPGMDMKVSSTIGYELAHNEALAITDEHEFVEHAICKLGPQPPNFHAIVAINRGALTSLDVIARPLSAATLEEAQEAGVVLVDVRADEQFDAAHIPGAVCNPAVRAGFGSKLGWICPKDREIAFVGGDDEQAVRATRLACSVGITAIAGYLAGGMPSWHEKKRAIQQTERIDVKALRRRLDDEPHLQVLDVRERDEWEACHIPGSVLCAYHDIDGIPVGIDARQPIAVICSSGQRSAVAASLLRRAGARRVVHVADGGVGTWGELGGPLTEA